MKFSDPTIYGVSLIRARAFYSKETKGFSCLDLAFVGKSDQAAMEIYFRDDIPRSYVDALVAAINGVSQDGDVGVSLKSSE